MTLKYYSESGMELTRAYTNAAGFDCKAMKFIIRFEDDEEVELDNVQYNARDMLLNEIYRRKDALKTCNITNVICDTGIHIEPENGEFWVLACANSRIVKTDLVLQNGVGIIDPDYRGPVKFFYASIHPSEDIGFMHKLIPSCGQLIPISGGAKTCTKQLVMNLEDLSSTERGEKGFGSSAK